MYNSRSWPYVSHFEGTERIIEHIEKFVAPTITSTDLTGQPAFRFKPDDRPRAVFLIGEDEYQTEKTLPAFAARSWSRWASAARSPSPTRSRRTTSRSRGARRRRPAGPERPPPGARRPRRWRSSAVTSRPASRSSASGRPAMRSIPGARRPPGHAEWTTFDPDVLGGHYTGHHGNDLKPVDRTRPTQEAVADPRGGRDAVHRPGSLYKTSPLASRHARS